MPVFDKAEDKRIEEERRTEFNVSKEQLERAQENKRAADKFLEASIGRFNDATEAFGYWVGIPKDLIKKL